MTHGASGIRVLVLVTRGRGASLPPPRERSRGLLFCEGLPNRVETIRAKAESGLLAKRGR